MNSIFHKNKHPTSEQIANAAYKWKTNEINSELFDILLYKIYKSYKTI